MIPASRLMRLEPIRARLWPWVLLVVFVALVAAGFYALPHDPPDVMAMIRQSAPETPGQNAVCSTGGPAVDIAHEQ